MNLTIVISVRILLMVDFKYTNQHFLNLATYHDFDPSEPSKFNSHKPSYKKNKKKPKSTIILRYFSLFTPFLVF